MPLSTSKDLQTLSDWSFLIDYWNYHTQLMEVAKIVHRTVTKLLGGVPSAVDCEDSLASSLLATRVFAKMLASKPHARPVLYLVFAKAMARHILDNDWPGIIRP